MSRRCSSPGQAADVTPHAFRAGISGDMHEEQVQWQLIAMWCRWHSMRAMRMYASRPALRTARTSAAFRLVRRTRSQPAAAPNAADLRRHGLSVLR